MGIARHYRGIVYVIGSGKLCVKGKMYKFVGVER